MGNQASCGMLGQPINTLDGQKYEGDQCPEQDDNYEVETIDNRADQSTENTKQNNSQTSQHNNSSADSRNSQYNNYSEKIDTIHQHNYSNTQEILHRVDTSTILSVPENLDGSSMPDSDLEEISSLESAGEEEEEDFQDCEENDEVLVDRSHTESSATNVFNEHAVLQNSNSNFTNSEITKSEYSKSIDTLSTKSLQQSIDNLPNLQTAKNAQNHKIHENLPNSGLPQPISLESSLTTISRFTTNPGSSLEFNLENPAESECLKPIQNLVVDIILSEENFSTTSTYNQLLCMNELMAIPLLLVTLETIGIEKIKEYVHIDSKKDFNPFGKAAMMIYGALLQQHFEKFGEVEVNGENGESKQSSSGVSCENESSGKSSQDELRDVYVNEEDGNGSKVKIENQVRVENQAKTPKPAQNSPKATQNSTFNSAKTGSDFVVNYVHEFIKSRILQESSQKSNSQKDANNSQNKINDSHSFPASLTISNNNSSTNDESMTSIENQISPECNTLINCDNYMYNIKRICAHDDLTLGHMLASKRCFPMQSKTGNTSPQEQIRESLQIHSALDIFLQLSCTAMHSISLWKVLNRSIFRLQKHLSLPITSLLNKVSKV